VLNFGRWVSVLRAFEAFAGAGWYGRTRIIGALGVHGGRVDKPHFAEATR